MSSGVVYGLFDPKTKLCHYVGSTNRSMTQRLAEHLCNGSRGAKGKWLFDLTRRKLCVKVKILEYVEHDDLREAENFWISYLRWLGMPLTNAKITPLTRLEMKRVFTVIPEHGACFDVPAGTRRSGLKHVHPYEVEMEKLRLEMAFREAFLRANRAERREMVAFIREDLARKKMETGDLFMNEQLQQDDMGIP